MGEFPRKIFYSPPPSRGLQFKNARATQNLGLVALSGAGFWALHGDHIIEGPMIIYAKYLAEMALLRVMDICLIAGVQKFTASAKVRQGRKRTQRHRLQIKCYGCRHFMGNDRGYL